VILILHGKDGLAEGVKFGLEERGRAVAIDLEVDMASMKTVRQAVAANKPVAVVMAEAWDDPDACEAEPDRAFMRNAEAVIHVAAACLEFSAVPVLLSIADVFGRSGGPWSESDEPSPISIWGESRLRGETLLRRAAKNALILRTGPILTEGLAKERSRIAGGSIEEADDEYVSPVTAREVGFAIDALLAASASGIFHIAPKERPVTKAEMWGSIARALGHPPERVLGRSGRTLARNAARARSTALLSDKLAKHLSRPLASWKTGMREAPLTRPPAAESEGSSREEGRGSIDSTRPPAAESEGSSREEGRGSIDSTRPPAAESEGSSREEGRGSMNPEPPRAPPKEALMGHKHEVRRIEKPWGHEIIWAQSDRYVGKVLYVKAGERLSLQYHERKDETIYVLSGKMVFEYGPKDQERQDLIMKAGDAFRITPFTTHRMIAIEDTQILEASTPELDDVVRLEDKYGRQGTKAP
jgi:mannose-6-phosphate isomerase